MLFTESEYRSTREGYHYHDKDCEFQVVATPGLDDRHVGRFLGIFPKKVPPDYHYGINLRRFEEIIQAIFADASRVAPTTAHIFNLKEIACSIVHWKMASQRGRAPFHAKNVREKWGDKTAHDLISAYQNKNMKGFEIPGVRIPTATAFMRFLFPNEYGIMDSRVADITQQRGITSLDIREDGYIKDTRNNREQYVKTYNLFLLSEASELRSRRGIFKDIDENGSLIDSFFRPCDIEMALFNIASQTDGERIRKRVMVS